MKSMIHEAMEAVVGHDLDNQQVMIVESLAIAAAKLRNEGKGVDSEERSALCRAIEGVAKCRMSTKKLTVLELLVAKPSVLMVETCSPPYTLARNLKLRSEVWIRRKIPNPKS